MPYRPRTSPFAMAWAAFGASIRPALGYDLSQELVYERVRLRHPAPEDYEDWAFLRDESRDFLVPWEPQWTPGDLTRISYRRRLRAYTRAVLADESYPFFVYLRERGPLIGGLTLNNVRRGVTQACSLGYWIGARFAGHGYMTEAVKLSLTFAFKTLRLHRVEAACVPTNDASRRVLEKCGFQREGYARAYHQINGIWEDHLLYAILASDERPA